MNCSRTHTHTQCIRTDAHIHWHSRSLWGVSMRGNQSHTTHTCIYVCGGGVGYHIVRWPSRDTATGKIRVLTPHMQTYRILYFIRLITKWIKFKIIQELHLHWQLILLSFRWQSFRYYIKFWHESKKILGILLSIILKISNYFCMKFILILKTVYYQNMWR